MNYNDVFLLFNDIIRGGSEVSTILKKTRAYNEGAKQLVQRMLIKNKAPGVLLVQDYDLATTINTNYVSLPSNYMAMQSIWKKVGSVYQKVNRSSFEIVSLETLQEYANTNFMDSTATFWNMLAMTDDKMFFDFNFSASDTDLLRIWYYKYPAAVVATDTFTIGTLSGNFTVGETVTGGTSGATATVNTNTATLLTVNSESVVGTFQNGETITGATSSRTAVLGSTISEKTQTLEFGERYKLALAESASALYLHFEGSVETQEKDAILDKIIEDLGSINKVTQEIRIRPGR